MHSDRPDEEIEWVDLFDGDNRVTEGEDSHNLGDFPEIDDARIGDDVGEESAAGKRVRKQKRLTDFVYYHIPIAECREGGDKWACPSQGCTFLGDSASLLRQHWQNRHLPLASIYLCPFKACTYRSFKHPEFFHHILTATHEGYGKPFSVPKEVSEFFKAVPVLAEVQKNPAYRRPTLAPGDLPRAMQPSALPVNSMSFNMKEKVIR